LAVFNMIPLPPLDGGRVAVGLLPDALAFPLARMERYGIFILLGFLIVLPMIGQTFNTDLDLLRYAIVYPAAYVLEGIGWLTGIHVIE
jgi:Zn-dependent protease